MIAELLLSLADRVVPIAAVSNPHDLAVNLGDGDWTQFSRLHAVGESSRGNGYRWRHYAYQCACFFLLHHLDEHVSADFSLRQVGLSERGCQGDARSG